MKPLPKKLSNFSESTESPGVRPGTKAFAIHKLNSYGGSLNHRKYKRPFDAQKSVHLIFRSKLLNGNRSLLRGNKSKFVDKLLKIKCKKYNGILHKWSAQSNYIHLLIRFSSPEDQSNFLREFSGLLASYIINIFGISKKIKVWDGRPFSMLVKNISLIKKYISNIKNELFGFWPYKDKAILSHIRFILRMNSPNETG